MQARLAMLCQPGLRAQLAVLALAFEVSHEPLENLDVTVDGDVDVVHGLTLLQVRLEVLHFLQQQRLGALEVLVDLAVFVEHVDDHFLLRHLGSVCRALQQRLL